MIQKISLLLIISGLIILWFYISPILKEEIKYQEKREYVNLEFTPENTSFYLYIPKIDAKSPVIANVDPYNEAEFRKALKIGVAHAKGTKYYLFAHSTDILSNFNKYNAVFYLLNKLEAGDEVVLWVNHKKLLFSVEKKSVVSNDALEYLEVNDEKTLILQTCYPPGTTLKRLIVIAKLKS